MFSGLKLLGIFCGGFDSEGDNVPGKRFEVGDRGQSERCDRLGQLQLFSIAITKQLNSPRVVRTRLFLLSHPFTLSILYFPSDTAVEKPGSGNQQTIAMGFFTGFVCNPPRNSMTHLLT